MICIMKILLQVNKMILFLSIRYVLILVDCVIFVAISWVSKNFVGGIMVDTMYHARKNVSILFFDGKASI
jgi:hypothetical protein